MGRVKCSSRKVNRTRAKGEILPVGENPRNCPLIVLRGRCLHGGLLCYPVSCAGLTQFRGTPTTQLYGGRILFI
nr:MAG TPA: hypothetical protein [Caudoviricetes sp.]